MWEYRGKVYEKNLRYIYETECRLCTIKDCDKCIDNDKFFAEEPTHSRKVCKIDCPKL